MKKTKDTLMFEERFFSSVPKWTSFYLGDQPIDEAAQLALDNHAWDDCNGTLYHELGHVILSSSDVSALAHSLFAPAMFSVYTIKV
jgi:hypothetical protein